MVKTKDNPVIRAKSLSRQTGAIGEFKVEWSKEVPDMNITELIFHYKFREYHYEKEFFKFELEKIKKIAENILDDFFKDEYKNEKHKEIKHKAKKLP